MRGVTRVCPHIVLSLQARPVRLFLEFRCRQQVSEFMLQQTANKNLRRRTYVRPCVCVRKKKHENQHLKNRKKQFAKLEVQH